MMKQKGSILMVMLLLLMFTNTALATNWVYYSGNNETRSYIDTETVYRSGSNLYFWELIMYDKDYDIYFAGDRSTIKYEVKLTKPRTMRELEFHDYDANNKEYYYELTPSKWWTVNSGDFFDGMINFALRYEKY